MKDILRWISFLPAAIVGGVIVSVIVLYMNPGLKDGSPIVGTIDSGFACLAFWYCFYRISDYVIPENGKKFAYWLSVVLCGLVVILGAISIIATPILLPKKAFDYEHAISIARTIGAAVALYLIYKKEK